MRVIPRSRLTRFFLRYPDATVQIRTWFAVMRHCRCTSESLTTMFPRMQRLTDVHVAFDIGCCKYWILANVRKDLQQVYVLDVLTASQYLRYRRTLLSTLPPNTDHQ